MMCIISKERIVFCAQVEGTRGEIFAVSPIPLQSYTISQERIAIWMQVEGIRGEILAGSTISLQFQWMRIPNEPIPTYGHSWPQSQSDHLKYGAHRTRRNGEKAIRGQEGTQRVELMPGAE
jgi:hypothetical protein